MDRRIIAAVVVGAVLIVGVYLYTLEPTSTVAYSLEEQTFDRVCAIGEEVEALRDQMQWYTLDIGQTYDIEGPIHFYSPSRFSYITPVSGEAPLLRRVRVNLHDENGTLIESIINQDTNWVRTGENYRSGQYLQDITVISEDLVSGTIVRRQLGFTMPTATIPGMDWFVVNLDEVASWSNPTIGLAGQCMVIETVEGN